MVAKWMRHNYMFYTGSVAFVTSGPEHVNDGVSRFNLFLLMQASCVTNKVVKSIIENVGNALKLPQLTKFEIKNEIIEKLWNFQNGRYNF